MNNIMRAIVKGEGDWSEVPRGVREAILHTLSHAKDAATAHSIRDGPRLSRSTSSQRSQQVVLPTLSEHDVQCSIDTFEDGLWVRDQAVRSYARFHNSVEVLYRAARGQLRSLWRTAMQLRPDYLEKVRMQLGLSLSDSIPEGVPIPQHYAVEVDHEEMILESMFQDLQQLREESVKFAANWLTDHEKIAMGANPAYLQAEAIDGETQRRSENRQKESFRNLIVKSETRRPHYVSGSPTSIDPCQKNSCIDEGLTMGDPKLIALLQQYAERLTEIHEKGGKGSSQDIGKHKH
ncbi:unnamed protein product [Phytomonas sp. Hart1]|nr:unnamed protein product [Phytomonas sp. Hart1]|eukprot:CCW71282.1 unnamed protein product [Phytomonas sp. isolate Hart1]